MGVTPATVNIAIKRRVEQEQRAHRSREQKLEDEKRERQEALIDAVRAYSRAARELYSQLIHYQFHHRDEDKEQGMGLFGCSTMQMSTMLPHVGRREH